MENHIIFDNIKQNIISHLNNAEKYIWVAVAWITDYEYLNILQEKINNGIDVRVVLMNDEFNKTNFINYSFLDENINLFLKESHHKYCIIDDEFLLTGSFNWTKKASTRSNGENLLLTNCKESIGFAKNNFLSLVENRFIPKKTVTDFYIQEILELSYNEMATEVDIKWWFSLTKDWKTLLFNEVIEDFDSTEINNYFNSLDLAERDEDSFDIVDLDKLEKFVLNEIIILVLNITRLEKLIEYGFSYDSDYKPLSYLKHLRHIEDIHLQCYDDLLSMINKNNNLKFYSIDICDEINGSNCDFSLLENVTEFSLRISNINEKCIKSLPNTIKSLSLGGNLNSHFNTLDFNWLSHLNKIYSLSLQFLLLHIDNSILKIPKVSLYCCEILDTPKELFNVESTNYIATSQNNNITAINCYKFEF